MGAIDRIRQRVQLAVSANENKPLKRPDLNKETGTTALNLLAIFGNEEQRSDKIKIADYRKMRDNDGTIRALYNVVTLPILANNYKFILPEGESGDAELELVNQNLTLPPHKGGISTPMQLVLAQMLGAIQDGFATFEKVFTLNDKNQIVYRKLAPRDAESVTLIRDDEGGFGGIRQKGYFGGESIDVTIPVERSFLFTHGKEESFLYGKSAFKAAWYHYDKKHKLYFLQHLAAQASSLPPRKLKIPSTLTDPAKISEVEMAADKFGIQQRITLPEGFDVTEYVTNPMDLTPSINHHNAEMARSLLAQFIMFGTDGKTGSYALGKESTDLFLLSEQAIMNSIEAHVNSYLIPQLIDLNFASGVYPEMKFNDLSDRTRDIAKEYFKEIITKDRMSDDFVKGIEKEIAEELGLNLDEIEAARGVVENAKRERQKYTQLAQKYGRPLTEAEKSVNLAAVNQRYEKAEKEFTEKAREILTKAKDDAVARVQKDIAKSGVGALKGFALKYQTEYRKLIENTMLDAYNAGKRIAADDLDVGMPQTPNQSKQFIQLQANEVASRQYQDLAFIVTSEVAKELRKNNLSTTELSLKDALAAIAVAFSAYLEDKTALAGTVGVAMALNLGRQDVFSSSSNKIAVYQYSAILDGKTTQLCRDLDGSVVSSEEYQATQWKPPCHFNCRSFWVAINKDDDFIPPITGLPKNPGGQSSPQLSYDNTAEAIEKFEGWIDEVSALRKELAKKQLSEKQLEELQTALDKLGA